MVAFLSAAEKFPFLALLCICQIRWLYVCVYVRARGHMCLFYILTREIIRFNVQNQQCYGAQWTAIAGHIRASGTWAKACPQADGLCSPREGDCGADSQ